jgi:membrane associated rhomboid family serine protease
MSFGVCMYLWVHGVLSYFLVLDVHSSFPLFLHQNICHLVGNVILQWNILSNVEQAGGAQVDKNMSINKC